jgi:hypothetical protein
MISNKKLVSKMKKISALRILFGRGKFSADLPKGDAPGCHHSDVHSLVGFTEPHPNNQPFSKVR